jgi:hypothetical protein
LHKHEASPIPVIKSNNKFCRGSAFTTTTEFTGSKKIILDSLSALQRKTLAASKQYLIILSLIKNEQQFLLRSGQKEAT